MRLRLVGACIAFATIFPAGVVSAQSQSDLLARVKPSVAYVSAQADQRAACGSAFAIDASGLLVTALRVVEDAQDISVRFPGGDPQHADVVAVDTKNDLAVLRVAQQNLAALPTADASTVAVGQAVVVVGYARCDAAAQDASAAPGTASAINRTVGGTSAVQLDGAIAGAARGGPALTSDGQLVGVADQVVAGGPSAQPVAFAVPAGRVSAVVTKALDPAKPHASLGLPLRSVTSKTITYKNSASIAPKDGTNVECVSSPPDAASTAGVHGELASPDVLNVGVWLTSVDDPGVRIGLLTPGKRTVDLDFLRPDQAERAPLTLCVSFRAQSGFGGGLPALIPLAFTATYTVRYTVWSQEVRASQ